MWIARDKDGSLWLFEDKPKREEDVWVCDATSRYSEIKELKVSNINNLPLPEITWENSPIELIIKTEESEEERIRKALIELVKCNERSGYLVLNNVSTDSMITWLEKQGDQKPAWSKEDDYNLQCMIAKVTSDIQKGNVGRNNELIEWLKSLKERTFTKKDVDDAYLKGVCDAKQELEKQGTTPKEFTLTYEAEVGNGNTKGLITEKFQLPKFHEGEWVVLTAGELSTTLQIVNVDTNKKLYWFNDNTYLPIVDEECLHLWTIEDAKDGDVLAWDNSKCIALFKNIYDKVSFNSHGCVGHCTGVFEPVLSYHDIEGARPATKEQCNLLFQKMKESGYKWDDENKELSNIVKHCEQKPVDKVKPKFHEGDWIIRSDEKFKNNAYLIKEVKDYYDCENLKGRRGSLTFSDVHKNFKLWDISDAKDGDVLISQYNDPFIYKWYSNGLIYSYGGILYGNEFHVSVELCSWTVNENIYPATKEQRDYLFQKMKEAGYKWDVENKELKKID